MRIKFYFIVFLLSYVLTNCSSFNSSDVAPHVKEAVRISNGLAKRLSEKYHMNVVAEGGALFEKVREIDLGFQIVGPLSKEALRCIVVDCIDEFLDVINEDEKIRPYLIHFPFLPRNINIDIFVIGVDGRHVCFPNIGIAGSRQGHFEYVTFDAEEKVIPYKTVEKETYAEAKLLCEHTIQL